MKNKTKSLIETLKEVLSYKEYQLLLSYFENDIEIEKAYKRVFEKVLITRLNLYK